MIRKKILLLGDFGVGKTSLIQRFVDRSFSDTYHTTIGVKISRKHLEIEGISCELLIWDIEGATPVKHIPRAYYKGASGAIFVADVNRTETMEGISEHIRSFMIMNHDAKYVIAYNKTDLLNETQKESLRQSIPGETFLTSAKEDQNVDRLFETLAKEILL